MSDDKIDEIEYVFTKYREHGVNVIEIQHIHDDGGNTNWSELLRRIANDMDKNEIILNEKSAFNKT